MLHNRLQLVDDAPLTDKDDEEEEPSELKTMITVILREGIKKFMTFTIARGLLKRYRR